MSVTFAPDTAEIAAPSVNVSNVNAGHLLGVLGLDCPDLCGTIGGFDLLGRVLVAVAVNPCDAGVPVTQTGVMVDCGRCPGYTDDRLDDLHSIAEWAIEHGVVVSFA